MFPLVLTGDWWCVRYPLAARPSRAPGGVRGFTRVLSNRDLSNRDLSNRVVSTRVLSTRVLGAVRALEVVGAPGAALAWRRLTAVAGGRRDANVRRRRGLGGYGGGVPRDRRAVRVFIDVAVMSAHDVEPSSVRTDLVLDFDWP